MAFGPNHNPWSTAEIEILRAHFGVKKAEGFVHLLPGRTVRGIHQKARDLGIVVKRSWTAPEIIILKQNWGSRSKGELAALLPHRKWDNISKKASSLRLKRRGRVPKTLSPLAIIRELRRVRLERGIEIEPLAASFNVYGSAVSAWETGMRNKSVPSLRSLMAWADALGFELWLRPKHGGFDKARAMARNASPSAARPT